MVILTHAFWHFTLNYLFQDVFWSFVFYLLTFTTRIWMNMHIVILTLELMMISNQNVFQNMRTTLHSCIKYEYETRKHLLQIIGELIVKYRQANAICVSGKITKLIDWGSWTLQITIGMVGTGMELQKVV